MIGAKKFVGALTLLALIFLTCASMAPQLPAITLNPGTTFQTMLGWEATAQAGQVVFKRTFPKYKDALLDATVNDLGINRIRLEIQSGSENPVDYFTKFYNDQASFGQWSAHWYDIINDNDDPFVINPAGFQFAAIDQTIDSVIVPIKQRVEARGEKFYLNLTYVDFGPSDFEHRNSAEEYAEYMLATFLHLREKYGWTPDAIEVVLEADNAKWSGTLLGQAIVATGDRLKAKGFRPAFVTPSCTNMSNAITFFDQLVQVPRVTEYIKELSYHRYGGVSDANLQAIGSRATQYGISTAHLELIGASYFDLHNDLSLARNSSWAQFTIAFPTSVSSDDGGKYYMIDDSNPDQPVVQIANRTKFLRQYFKYVRRGAVRIEATSDDAGLHPLAFVNSDCKQTIIVRADYADKFLIHGLPAGTYGLKYTTDAKYDIDSPDVTISAGQPLQGAIPAPGVITIYAKSVSCAPLVSASAANYRPDELAVESIVAVFGKDLANSTIAAAATPLPTALGETSVKVTDAKGVSGLAPLYFVSQYQINYQIPPATATGPAVVTVTRGGAIVALSSVSIAAVAPGIFTADASGGGLPAAAALRVKADGSQEYEPILRFDAEQNRFVPIPIDLGPDLGAQSDRVFLVVFGTGFRRRSALSVVKVYVKDVEAQVANAEATPGYVGLDQVAFELSRSLAGSGDVGVRLLVDGKEANPVVVNVK